MYFYKEIEIRIIIEIFTEMKLEKKITTVKVNISKTLKDRKGIMGTGKDLAFISDNLFDEDLKK